MNGFAVVEVGASESHVELPGGEAFGEAGIGAGVLSGFRADGSEAGVPTE